jgi:hypothetical protein
MFSYAFKERGNGERGKCRKRGSCQWPPRNPFFVYTIRPHFCWAPHFENLKYRIARVALHEPALTPVPWWNSKFSSASKYYKQPILTNQTKSGFLSSNLTLLGFNMTTMWPHPTRRRYQNCRCWFTLASFYTKSMNYVSKAA